MTIQGLGLCLTATKPRTKILAHGKVMTLINKVKSNYRMTTSRSYSSRTTL